MLFSNKMVNPYNGPAAKLLTPANINSGQNENNWSPHGDSGNLAENCWQQLDRWADSVDNVGNNGAECECYSADPLYSAGIKKCCRRLRL